MKKRLIVLTMAAALGLAACGGSSGGSGGTTTTPATTAAQTEAPATEEATIDEAAVEDYVGVWEYDDYYLWYVINDDGTWSSYNAKGEVYDVNYSMDGSKMVLGDLDGSVYMELYFQDGVLTDSDGDTLFSSEIPDYYGYLGVWEYDDYYLWFDIHPDGTYTAYDDDGIYVYEDAYVENYPYEVYDDGIGLMDASGEAFLSALLPVEGNGDALQDGEGDTLFRSELPNVLETEN